MAQDLVREKVVGALQDALRQAKQKGQLTIDPFPTVSLDLPKRAGMGRPRHHSRHDAGLG